MRTLLAVVILAGLFGCTATVNENSLPWWSKVGVKAEGVRMALEMSEVSAWCDHMPLIDPKPGEEIRQFLVVTFTVKNKTSALAAFEILSTNVSLHAESLGASAYLAPLNANDRNESATDRRMFFAKPGESREFTIHYRNGSFPEGNHKNTVYVTIVVDTGDKRLILRGQGVIAQTQ